MGLEVITSAQKVMQVLMSVVLVVAALYFGREVLLPLAMAVLLTFLLSPVVTFLERRHLPRVPAVLLVMVVIAISAGSIAWVIGTQLTDLAIRLPTFKENLKEKVESVKFTGGAFAEVQETIKDVQESTSDEVKEIPEFRVVPNEVVPFATLAILTNTVLTPAANAAIILVLVIFMLINREDLRNRFVRLAGTRLTVTTRTLDEVGTRISRYLLMNALVNGTFGVAVAIGLMLIGVEYALMWGFLAAALRFVPYVGPIMAAVMPIAMAFIQFNDWAHVAMAAGLFIMLELITNNIVEPLAYGHSTGVSTVALLISAVFWTWIWGPMGLVLSVPLTVVLAVLGEHVAPLEPLAILLGDKPALANYISYYQRLLASDIEEAGSILEEQAKISPLLQIYDEVVIPALVLAEKDHESGELSEASQQFVWQSTREFIDELDPTREAQSSAENLEIDSSPGLKANVLGCPAHDEADEMALAMLGQNLALHGGSFQAVTTAMLASELVTAVSKEQLDAICISSLGPVGVRQTRYLCKRLRQAHPDLRIIVGRWGYHGDRDRLTAGLKRRGADHVVTSLAEARNLLERLQPLKAAMEESRVRQAAARV